MHRASLFFVCLCVTSAAAEAEIHFGLAERVPWETSRLLGTPDPPLPYLTERVYPHIKLDGPLDLCISPNGQRWFACEDKGVIYTFPHSNEAERADIFLDLRRKDHRYLQWFQQRRMWSMAFHPKYSDNGYVYVCYHDSLPGPSRTRLSRFTVDLKNPADPPNCDPDTEFIVAEWQAGIDHFGGCLKFGNDGLLYVSVGDGSAYADGTDTGQDLSDFHCSVLRIDVDRNDKGKSYAVPNDNPFVDLKGARGEVWAYGLRNVWKMSIDRETGDLWGGDVGQDLWDWIVRIEKGGNYGWSVTEGSHPFRPNRKVGPTPIQKPIVEHEHSEARSITGGFVYRGKRLHATSLALGKSLSLRLAEDALSDLVHSHGQVVRLGDIERAICDVFGLETESLKSDRKGKGVSHPRMLAMWLARKHTRAALSEIGHYFGRRTHSTVISAQKKIDAWMAKGSSLELPERSWKLDEAIRRVEESLRAG